MKRFVLMLTSAMLLIAAASFFAFAQGSSAQLAGTVVDQSGGVIPGAEVSVKNDASGEEYKAVTAENGTFSIPAMTPGTYTATVNVPNFKVASVKEVKLTAGTTSTIKVTMQVGGSSEVVTVQANAEIVQASSANITTTLGVSQISQLPMATRNAMDFLVLLPGANTTGGSRATTFNGLPNNAINITIDGVPAQDQYLKGSQGGDGFFSLISPRLDAIEEVTVSSATPGAESGGQGAVQIKFVTRSGNNDYHGSAYLYHRNPALNSNYWFNNRDKTPTYNGTSVACTPAQMQTEFDKCKAQRDRVLFNQPGGRIGGPITLPKSIFGPLGFNGKDRAFFFVNYEEFRLPAQQTRTRTFFGAGVENGIFPYTVGGVTQTVNLYTLAAANGQTATPDPTIQKLLTDIRAAAKDPANAVTEIPQTDPLYENYIFTNKGLGTRKFLTTRGDFNITSKHRLELSWNFHRYVPGLDFLNNYDPAYPGSPNVGMQYGNRFSESSALRSTLTPRLVNEARVGLLGGITLFNGNGSPGMYSGSAYNMDGFAIAFPTGYSPYRYTTPSRRSAPNETVDDTVSWTKGSHSFSFGGSWSNIGIFTWSQQLAPTISLGVNTSNDPAAIMFNSTNGPKNFPSASSTQYGNAQTIYALLTGRVSAIGGSGILSETTNQYTYNGATVLRGHMRELGIFAQDSWRIRPGFTFTYGVRWEVQMPFVPLNSVMTTNTIADLWGISGPQNFGNGALYTPSTTTTGSAPTYKQFTAGTQAYNTSWKDFAPSMGFAWSPSGSGGFLNKLMGDSGQTVIRGGFSLAYNRNGMYDYLTMYSANPGVSISATRNATNGNLVNAGETWPILFRDKSRLGPPAFASAPVYPIPSTSISDQVNLFDPNTRTPYTMSWSIGIQRELTKSTALEVRYVATRNMQPWAIRNLNEQNLVENGFMAEFQKAMANLTANQAAYPTTDAKHNSFAYTGAAGTSPLPITLAYFSGYTAAQATDPTKYNSSNFTSSTFVNTLAKYGSSPSSYASSLWSDATRRANAITAGLPANEFVVNPTVASGGTYISTNGGFNRYDSMVVELRRRLAKGLLLSANYTWAKAMDSSRTSYRVPYLQVLGNTLPQAFKVNWVYELPVGNGKWLFSGAHGVVDRVLGGWEVEGTGRIQAGNLLNFGNVRLVGMTLKDLQDAVGLRFDDANRLVYYEPEDIRVNTIAAFNYQATTTATNATGYSTQWGIPTGRYLAPASQGDCLQVVNGDCAGYTTYVRGPKFSRFDISLVKRIRFSETKNFELRGEFLNAFNNINFFGTTCAGSSATCGQVTSAYTDPNQQQDPGGRLIQFVMRINF